MIQTLFLEITLLLLIGLFTILTSLMAVHCSIHAFILRCWINRLLPWSKFCWRWFMSWMKVFGNGYEHQVIKKEIEHVFGGFDSSEFIKWIDPEEESAEIYELKSWLSDSVRLECAITPRRIHSIIEYAELCITDGMYLDEAIQLLQVSF